ncbi:MAG: DNA polymerase III subunit delta' [Rhodospirillales bacterium]
MKAYDGGQDGEEWPPPRQNPDLQGHEEAELALHEAFSSGRLPHAWLIAGRRGIGKATLAHRFARFVLANGGDGAGGLFAGELPVEGPVDGSVDGSGPLYLSPHNPVFRRTAAAGHADLITVERSLNDKGKLRTEIVVDDVRQIGSFLGLTSAEGGWRVVIIDCADEMNRHGANAVLKVLEEPPPRALLLLVSHAPGRLLATIRSRCRRLQLKPLAENEVAGLVREYLPDLTAGEIGELAGLAEGSIGRALGLAKEGGVELYRDLMAILNTLNTMGGLDVSALHSMGDRVGGIGAGDTFHTVSELLTRWLGRLVMFAAHRRFDPGGGGGAGFGEDDGELMARLAQAGGLDCWLGVWEKVTRLLARTDSVNLDRKQVFIGSILALENAVRS